MADLRTEHTGGVTPDDEPDDDFERRPGRGPLHTRVVRAPGSRPPRARTVVLAAVVAIVVIAGGTIAALALRNPASTPPAAATVNLPPGRAGAAMAYDSVAGLTVMYGGYNARGDNLYDTWTWDGSAWRARSTPGQLVPRLFSPSMADDPADGGVILVGATVPGQNVPCAPAAVLDCGSATTPPRADIVTETWLFTGATWQQVTGIATQPSTPLSLAAVPNSPEVVAVADTTDRNCRTAACPLTPTICVSQPVSDDCLNSIRVSTWYWSAKHWTAISQVLDLDGGMLVVPTARGSTIEVVSLFAPIPPSCINADGGCPVVPDVPRAWNWSAGSWVADPATTVLPPLQGGATALNGSNAALLDDNGGSWQLLNGTWTAVGQPAPFGQRSDPAFAVDRDGYYVVFGGAGPDGGAGNDTWLLNSAGWKHAFGESPTPEASPVRTAALHARCAGHTTIPEYLC